MIKLGNLALDGTPRIAVCVADKTEPSLLRDMKANGVDIVEIRIDQFHSFTESYVLRKVSIFNDIPTIGTIRSKAEGGSWNSSEEKRLMLFNAIASKVDAIDIELSSQEILPNVVKTMHKLSKPVIISYHNFTLTPSHTQLRAILKRAVSSGADIVKIATHCSDDRAMKSLARFTLLESDRHNLITVAMGARGALSRLCFPALGSLITYSFLEVPTAPGQFDFQTTLQRLREFYPKVNEEKINNLKLMECI